MGLFGVGTGLGPTARFMTAIDQGLLKMMACPVSHAPVVQLDDWIYSTDRETRRRYPIRDGIPIMLIDDSEVVEPEAFDRVMSQVGTAKNEND